MNDELQHLAAGVLVILLTTSKKDIFAVILNQNQPVLVFGCESWLSPAVHNAEIFPPDCKIYRPARQGRWLWRCLHSMP